MLDYLREHNTAYFWEIATSLSTVEHPVQPETCREVLADLIEQGKAEHAEFQQYRIKL